MKKITKQLLVRFSLILGGVIFIVLLASYMLLKSLFLEQNIALDLLNTLYIELLLFSFILLPLAFYFYKKTVDTLQEEIDSFQNYIDKIDQKEYEATFKAKHFQEFLQLSVSLKNIIKRLYSKDKKKK